MTSTEILLALNGIAVTYHVFALGFRFSYFNSSRENDGHTTNHYNYSKKIANWSVLSIVSILLIFCSKIINSERTSVILVDLSAALTFSTFTIILIFYLYHILILHALFDWLALTRAIK